MDYLCRVNQPGQETDQADDAGDGPSLPFRERVTDDSDDATAVRHGAAKTQSEHHQEEDDGEKLRPKQSRQDGIEDDDEIKTLREEAERICRWLLGTR